MSNASMTMSVGVCWKTVLNSRQKKFRSSCNIHKMPTIWKAAIIVPAPKSPGPSGPKDFRPITCTLLVMTCFELLMERYIMSLKQNLIDPLQFAYQAYRRVEDTLLTLLHALHALTQRPKTHANILFVDLSSAFYTILPRILADKLETWFSLPPGSIVWIVDFLSSRTQQVWVETWLSHKLSTLPGPLQGCVLSPLLLILYTNSCTSTFPNRHFVKCADDAALVGLLHDWEKVHWPVVDYFLKMVWEGKP